MSKTQHVTFAAGAACAVGIIVLGSAVDARAQIMPNFGNRGPFLNRADFVLADVAARKLLEPQPASIGTAANWANPASGNSGTLTMGRTYEKNGHDCRTVSWHDVFKAGAKRTVLLNTCRISGVWKLM